MWTRVSSLTLLVAGSAAAQLTMDSMRDYELVMKGHDLSAEDALVLEQRLEQDPDDLSARYTLLGYYFLAAMGDKDAQAAKANHILWLIRNAPEADVLGFPEGTIESFRNSAAYEEGKAAWEDQLERNPTNPKLFAHAANFVQTVDMPLAIEFMEKACDLDPENTDWRQSLAQLYILKAKFGAEEDAAKALEHLETAYDQSAPFEKDYMLAPLADAAFNSDLLDKARAYAERMLEVDTRDWNYGNNIHHGNLILGRIALREGNVEEAKARLLAAGKTPGSPQLNSFGPNMTLAKELLKRGEDEVVLEYLKRCRTFWGRKELHDWAKDIHAGKMPNFGLNLVN